MTMTQLATKENLDIKVQRIGHSGEPLIVIDDFLNDPVSLVEAASLSQGWSDVPAGGYPGRRAGLPTAYAKATLRRLNPIIQKHIFGKSCTLGKFECSFSLVTRKPEELSPQQRIPHIDVASDRRVAILHYLCNSEFGGTAFFRQDRTGFEQIPDNKRPEYLQARHNDLEDLPDVANFANAKTPGYTQTATLDAKFNRIAIYRSFTLHSGIINSPSRLSEQPAKGRLTANFFVDYEDAGT